MFDNLNYASFLTQVGAGALLFVLVWLVGGSLYLLAEEFYSPIIRELLS